MLALVKTFLEAPIVDESDCHIARRRRSSGRQDDTLTRPSGARRLLASRTRSLVADGVRAVMAAASERVIREAASITRDCPVE
jgi:hypothetical protein